MAEKDLFITSYKDHITFGCFVRAVTNRNLHSFIHSFSLERPWPDEEAAGQEESADRWDAQEGSEHNSRIATRHDRSHASKQRYGDEVQLVGHAQAEHAQGECCGEWNVLIVDTKLHCLVNSTTLLTYPDHCHRLSR